MRYPPPVDTVPVTPQRRVKLEVYLPAEVFEWLDRAAATVYKSRSRYAGDLLVTLYREETTTTDG